MRGKVVCVTGSARRVGRAIALAFAEAGAHVVIHHHASDEDASQTAVDVKALGVEALVVKANLAMPDEVAAMFEHIQTTFGRLDVMVNSAANYYKNHLLDISYEEWQTVLGVNLTGPFLCTQHAARLMPDGGCIINIGDNGGTRPWKSRPHHSVSKAGLLMLTKVSALSLGERNIRVNCIIPGPVLLPPGEPDNAWDGLAQLLPLKRTGHPTDVAQACLFLATNEFITGAILNVDGGEAIR